METSLVLSRSLVHGATIAGRSEIGMTLIDLPPDMTASSAIVFVDVPASDGSSTRHLEADKSLYGDPLIETPMQFVAVEAHPNRSPEDEPLGSGPFGF